MDTNLASDLGKANGTFCIDPPIVELDNMTTESTLVEEAKGIVVKLHLNAAKRIVVAVDMLPESLNDKLIDCKLKENDFFALFPASAVRKMEERKRMQTLDTTNIFNFTSLNGNL